ncbi:MAG: CoA-binding protein [Chromatiaceae bacterium]|nr:CoA-binding protein [Chromatiaceae bacterium]
MTIRNLDALFKPKSIALIGASTTAGSLGALLVGNLSAAGFRGDVFLVNPKYEKIGDLRSYPDIASLPQPVDLGVIYTPSDSVPGIVAALGELGARAAAVVITAGFGEGQEAHGLKLQHALAEEVKSGQLRIVGPNCLGILVPGIGLNASFAHRTAKDGMLAFVAQSGAIVTSVLDWADARGIGFFPSRLPRGHDRRGFRVDAILTLHCPTAS